MNKNCKDIVKLLSNYLLEEDLSQREKEEIKQHLSICKKCKKEFEDLSKTVKIIKNLPKYTVANSILTKINKKIDERKTFWERLSPFSFRISLGTVSLVIIALVSVQLYRYISITEKKLPKEYKLDSSKKEDIKNLDKKGKEDHKEKVDRLNTMKKVVSQESKSQQMLPSPALVMEMAEKDADKESSDGKMQMENNVKYIQKKELSLEDQAKGESAISAGVPKEGLGGGGVVTGLKEEAKRAGKSGNEEMLSSNVIGAGKSGSYNLDDVNKYKDIHKERIKQRDPKEKESNELKGIMCGFKEKDNFVIKTQADWENLWKKVFPEQKIPQVDFDKKMAILVFAGEKMTGGYEINIKEINYEKDKIIVKISETIPPRNAFCIMVITSPFHIKIIDKSDLQVEFIFE